MAELPPLNSRLGLCSLYHITLWCADKVYPGKKFSGYDIVIGDAGRL
jgi:hypothetical protein